jgi:hypothetical protein
VMITDAAHRRIQNDLKPITGAGNAMREGRDQRSYRSAYLESARSSPASANKLPGALSLSGDNYEKATSLDQLGVPS